MRCGIFEIEFESYEAFKEAVRKAREDKRIERACRQWLGEWSFIPTALLEKAYGETLDEIEIIAPSLEHSNCDGDCEYCRYEYCGDAYYEDVPKIPAWSYIFVPKEEIDKLWIKECAEVIAEWCGVIVYYAPEIGYYVGINGAGYDFYIAHWIPLYILRGLKWHENL